MESENGGAEQAVVLSGRLFLVVKFEKEMKKTTENNRWKDIPGYEGFYQISSTGTVRGLDRIVKSHSNTKRICKGRIMNPVLGKHGYYSIELNKLGHAKLWRVHRLVAMTFIPNPKKKPAINHKDCNKKNNRASNLEWCTLKENAQHALANGLMKFKTPKRIAQYDINGRLIKIWPTQKYINAPGVSPACVSAVLQGKIKCGMHKGFQWKYFD